MATKRRQLLPLEQAVQFQAVGGTVWVGIQRHAIPLDGIIEAALVLVDVAQQALCGRAVRGEAQGSHAVV